MSELPESKTQYMVVPDGWDPIITSWPKMDTIKEARQTKAYWDDIVPNLLTRDERQPHRIIKATTTYEWVEEGK